MTGVQGGMKPAFWSWQPRLHSSQCGLYAVARATLGLRKTKNNPTILHWHTYIPRLASLLAYRGDEVPILPARQLSGHGDEKKGLRFCDPYSSSMIYASAVPSSLNLVTSDIKLAHLHLGALLDHRVGSNFCFCLHAHWALFFSPTAA